ncbi:MAG: ABC transporter permease subunit, partial [Sphaerochaetaceae bacterium]
MIQTMKIKKKFGIAEAVLIFSILILIVVVALPVLMIFFTAFFKEGKINIAGIVEVLRQKDTYLALKNSLVIATGVTLLSTLLGVFFAWLVARTDIPGKKALKEMFHVPFMLPSFICAMAWKVLLSPRSGYINKWFMQIFGLDNAPFNIMTLGGIIVVETMYLFPFVFLQVAGALERMDPTLEESARISGASLGTITRKITLPLVLPSIVAGALLVFL